MTEQTESEKLYTFKRTLKKLRQFRGSGTQLVSVYIPASYPIPEIAAKIREEMNQAQNIKSKQTRNNVIAALDRINNALKHFKKTPPNGLVLFAGNISPDPSKTDIQTFILEPLYKLNQSVYRCDSTFFLEPLERMVKSDDAYGILAIEGRESTLALLRGTEITILEHIHNPAHAKVRKGGQSARRYERLVEEATERYYKKVGEAMDKHFLNKVKGIIIGGPGPVKEYFVKTKPFNYQHKILGVVDTGYADEHGIHEIIEKADEILQQHEAIKEKNLVQRFIKEVVKGGKAIYGYKDVVEAIKSGRAELVLVSDEIPLQYFKFKCPNDGTEKELIVKPDEVDKIRLKPLQCPKCNAAMEIEEDDDITDHIISIAEEHNIPVEVISKTSAEGMQFFKGFYGLGAFLKY